MNSCDFKYGHHTKEKTQVLCTTGIIAECLANLLPSEKFEIFSLMGPGVDPHSYKATYGDIRKIRDADILISNGLYLEGKLEDIFLQLGKDKPHYMLGDFINDNQLIYQQGQKDPHIWHDVALWSNALKALIQVDEFKGYANSERSMRYLSQLDSLDNSIQKLINSIPIKKRILVTSHDAFSYYGKRYGLEIAALQGFSTLAEFGIGDIKRIRELVLKNEIPVVFPEHSLSDRSMRALLSGIDQSQLKVSMGEQLYSDALSTVDEGSHSYILMLSNNTNTITNGLSVKHKDIENRSVSHFKVLESSSPLRNVARNLSI
ncbi:MAG: zinc ABC transporter substrate-binding protein [Cyclobacteriaceae bacterium]|nr:zinc ABC transporter substrate-binding protein [Cyclobacteriaceae bacterium]